MCIHAIKEIGKETDKLLPINNYAWSKLGGESSVQMLKKFSYIKTINYGLSFCLQKSY